MNRRELPGRGRLLLGLKRGNGIASRSCSRHDFDDDPLAPFTPTDSDPWDYQKAAHLLRRCMIGPTDAEIRMAASDGMEITLARLMEPFEPDLDLIADFAGRDPEIGGVEADDPRLQVWQGAKLARRERLGRWWLKVIANAPLSIQERMTLFWHGHFVTEMPAVEYAEFMYSQNRLLRRFALGNFKEFVWEITRDMAMLIYLNGTENRVDGNVSMVNENYARELMELFTMGVTDWRGRPNYTQKDVVGAARSLSGWWYRLSPDGEHHRSIESRFAPERWDSGVKTFLGQSGTFGARDVIDIIFAERKEQVAKFICGKLYRAFVNGRPDHPVIARMAETLIAAGWELRPVLLQLLGSAHFYASDNIGCLHKSSVDFYVGLIRGLGAGNVPDFEPGVTGHPYNDLLVRLQKLGHMLFFPPNVKGWPGGRNWTNVAALPARQKFALDLADERIGYWRGPEFVKTCTFDPLALPRGCSAPEDIELLCDEMIRYLLPAPPSPAERAQLYAALLDGGADYEWSLDDPAQRPADRIRRFLKTAFKLPKYQLH